MPVYQVLIVPRARPPPRPGKRRKPAKARGRMRPPTASVVTQAGHTRVPPGHHGAHAQPVEHGLDGHVLLILGVVGRVVRIVLWPAALAVRVAFTLR